MVWAAIGILSFGAVMQTQGRARAARNADGSATSRPLFVDPVSEGLGRLQSPDRETCEDGVRKLENLRNGTVCGTLRMADPANAKDFSEATRICAADLLGESTCAVEAVPILVKVLVNGEIGPKVLYDISPYDSPVSGALLKIGLPSVPALTDAIRQSEGQESRLPLKSCPHSRRPTTCLEYLRTGQEERHRRSGSAFGPSHPMGARSFQQHS